MMLYPLSLLDLALPLPLAISLATVLHTLLAGTFTVVGGRAALTRRPA